MDENLNNPDLNAYNPEEVNSYLAAYLVTKRTKLDEFGWYCMVMGFIGILLAGLCFFLFRNQPLRYENYSLNANVLGKYLLMAGFLFYTLGRIIYYIRRAQIGKAEKKQV